MGSWGIFSILGTISFSLQGGLIAMEKKYDLFSVYLFGMITSFGGGIMRHIVIGESDFDLWNQYELYFIAIAAVTFGLIFPNFFVKGELFWVSILDTIGVIAFAIEGSIAAVNLDLPPFAVIVSALITATGGGVLRDLLSQRRPIVLGENIYTLWLFLIGLIIGMRWANANLHFILLYVIFVILRLLTVYFDWKIPYRTMDKVKEHHL